MRVRDASEEPVRRARSGCQRRPGQDKRGGARTGLVECDVAVLADAAEEELDAADGLDRRLVARALGDEVRRVPVEDVHLRRSDVDVREELAEHERVVRLGVRLRQPDVLVHVEGHYVLETVPGSSTAPDT